MEARKWLDKKFNEIRDRYVKLILFPTPPTPVGNIVFMPDSFSSATFDSKVSRNDQFKLISMLPTTYGPAILARVMLSKLILVEKGFIRVNHATCCASVTFTILLDADGLRYANKTTVNNVGMISRSCHPGSHFVIPSAPYLTAMLHYVLAPDWDPETSVLIGNGKIRGTKMNGFQYMSPWEARGIFEYCDFSDNILLDRFVSRCLINPEVTYYRAHGGLGLWSKPYIKWMRDNLKQVGEMECEQWATRAYRVFEPALAGGENNGS